MDEHIMDNWKRIWGNRQADQTRLASNDTEEVFMELKRLTGNDTIGSRGGVSYKSFTEHLESVCRELSFSVNSSFIAESFFEVGCGSGGLLFLIQKKNPDIVIGGADYSETLVEAARKVLSNPRELYCAEAVSLDTSVKYDSVFSFSVFEYFRDYEYARSVLERMLQKTNYSVGILDVHDLKRKDDYNEFRRSVIRDYDTKYADLMKLFYDKSFFVDFADKNNLDIKITGCRLEEYWNAPFTYDVYFYKRENGS